MKQRNGAPNRAPQRKEDSMKYIDIGERGNGKSTRLLKYAIRNKCNIAVATKASVNYYQSIAREIMAKQICDTGSFLVVDGVIIAPLSFYISTTLVPAYRKPLLIDEISASLSALLGCEVGYTDNAPYVDLQVCLNKQSEESTYARI